MAGDTLPVGWMSSWHGIMIFKLFLWKRPTNFQIIVDILDKKGDDECLPIAWKSQHYI